MRVTSIVSALFLGMTVVSAAPAIDITTLEDRNALEARGLTVSVARAPPSKEVCAATNNGPGRVYPEHTYTSNQLTAALRTAATLQADKKQVGLGKYPHAFNNNEQLEFPCGAQKMEFPIQQDGSTYNDGDTNNLPDRVVYEWTATKTDLKVKFCGVMRHGPVGGRFIKCTS